MSLTARSRIAILLAMSLVAVFGLLMRASLSSTLAQAETYTWRNITIKGGGFVSGIILHPTEPGLMYARTDVGGAYRWDAPSARWMPITDWIGKDDSNYLGIESLALDPVDPDRVYLAGGTYTQSWAGNGAFLRSSDMGATWEITPVPFKMGGNEDGRSNGERLVVDPNNSAVLFFGSRKDGLWKSADYGAGWTRITSFPVTSTTNGVGIPIVQFVKSSGSVGSPTPVIYAGVSQTGTSLYRTTDAGETWQAVAGQPAGIVPHHTALDSDGTLYLAYSDGAGPNGATRGAVWKHATTGGTWTSITPPTGQGGFAGVSIDPQRPGTLVVTTMDRWFPRDELYRSTNGGSSWAAVLTTGSLDNSSAPWSVARTPHWLGDVEIDPLDSNRVLFVTGYGIWVSDNLTAADSGGTLDWAFVNDGIEETVPLALISPPAGAPLLSALGDIGGFRHEDFNTSPPLNSYFLSNRTTNTSIDFAENAPNVVARVHWGNSRGSQSTDGGTTWSDFGSTLSAATANGPGTVAVSADGNRFVWLPKGSIAFYSTDGGSKWKKCKKSPAAPNDSRSMWPTADRVNSNTFYLYDIISGRVYVSTNGGVKFKAKGPALPSGGGMLRAVPGFEGHLWLPGWTGGLHRSTNTGNSFTRVTSVQEAYQLGFGKAAPGKGHPAIYLWGKVDGITGIFRSDDVGAKWVRINDDQHQYGWINVITGDPRTYERVYLATGGRGIVYGEP